MDVSVSVAYYCAVSVKNEHSTSNKTKTSKVRENVYFHLLAF
jgi:hypothetical protein